MEPLTADQLARYQAAPGSPVSIASTLSLGSTFRKELLEVTQSNKKADGEGMEINQQESPNMPNQAAVATQQGAVMVEELPDANPDPAQQASEPAAASSSPATAAGEPPNLLDLKVGLVRN